MPQLRCSLSQFVINALHCAEKNVLYFQRIAALS